MQFTADGHKVNRKVIYPSQLNVPKYWHEGQHKNVRSIAVYSLCTVIVHEGTQSFNTNLSMLDDGYGGPQVSRQFILKLRYIKSRITANINFIA